MPRIVRDEKIKSRGDRAKLAIRYAPYWAAADEHLHIGYRKGPKGGLWLARKYLGNGKYRRSPIGVADDKITGPADGVDVLSFDQAAKLARKQDKQPAAGPLTVGEAFAQYVEFLENHKRSPRQAREAKATFKLHVAEELFDKPLADLTRKQVLRIQTRMVSRDPDDPEVLRRSQATANRIFASIKAAFNKAYEDEDNKIPSNAAWRLVKNFEDVAGARKLFLDPGQQQRLVNASQEAFRNFVIACLLVGLRPPHEVALLKVRDFHADHAMLTVTAGKTGKREITLTPEAVEFFQGLAAGRAPDAPLLPKDDGRAWVRNEHLAPMKEAVKRAGLPPDCTAYVLRHSYASQALRNGMNIQLLAENMGTSVAMIEKHYGKFAPSTRRALVAQHGPTLGLVKDDKVMSIAKSPRHRIA